MAFARLFPIDAVNAQDDDRTASELSLSDGTSCGSPRRTGQMTAATCPRSPCSSTRRRRRHHARKSYRNLSLHKDAPILRTIQTVGRTLAMPVLGGLHHQYKA
jgi:hypothetical protein